jgi:hypothetical protein
MASEEIARWFDASGAFFEEIDAAAEGFLTLVGTEDRLAFELAADRLLAAVVRGQALPLVPDPEARRHFAAGLARYRDGAETLFRTADETETKRAVRAILAAGAEFARMGAAIDKLD